MNLEMVGRISFFCQILYIGRVCLARENEAGDSWGPEIHILHVFVCNNRTVPK